MCLITRQKEAKIAKENIVVYKRVVLYEASGDIVSPSRMNYQWELGVVQTEKLVVDNYPETYMGYIVLKKYPRCMRFDNNEYTHVHDGLHSMTKKRCDIYEREVDSRGYGNATMKCIIPKGAEYYNDVTGLYVSNQLKPLSIKPDDYTEV